jgi:hypothetical protein
LSLACFAGQSGQIRFSGQVVAGSAQLPPGIYKVELQGTNASFTQIDVSPSQDQPIKPGTLTTAVKVENIDKKFDLTSAATTKDGNVIRVHSINLAGTKVRLVFD